MAEYNTNSYIVNLYSVWCDGLYRINNSKKRINNGISVSQWERVFIPTRY